MTPAAQFILRFEGYAKKLPDGRCATYLCSAGVLTIGVGATGAGVYPGAVWTREQAFDRFERDLKKFQTGAFEMSPNLASASESRQVAIVSFCYNLGLGAYRSSTLRKKVNLEDWEEAARQILRWDRAAGKKVRGLTLRRTAEAALLLL